MTGDEFWQNWVPMSYQLLAHLAAASVEHRRDVALATHTYIYVERSNSPGLRVRIVAVYRVHRDNDESALTDEYHLGGRTRKLIAGDKYHRIFVGQVENADTRSYHALNLPIADLGILLRPPVDFYMYARLSTPR